MSIGIKRGTVKVVPYDPNWADEFEAEKQLLLKEFGGKVIAIEHIGSTSIPYLPAKPIIDINVAIPSLAQAEEFIKPLQNLGYEYMPERWFEDRYFFPKGTQAKRTHHLNLVEITNDIAWQYPLLFRNYLITHSDMRKAYGELKLKLSVKYAYDRAGYTEAKSSSIAEVLSKAKHESGMRDSNP